MWILLVLGVLLLSAAGVLFLIIQFAGLFRLRRRYALAAGSGITIGAGIFLWFTLGAVNTVIILIHLLLCWLLSSGLWHLLRRQQEHQLQTAITAVCLCAVWLGVGAYSAYHVSRTQYAVETADLPAGSSFRIVGFSDSHVGTTFHGEGLAGYVAQMNEEDADIAVIVGDFIDDDTSYEDLVRSCEALSHLHTRYGTYYVFGNHDAGYYGSRGYGKDELVSELVKNGICVLADDSVRLTEHVLLLGREDARQQDRMAMTDYSLSDDDLVIILDHQPADYEAEAAAGADLVISGHTHGGQFFPVNHVGEWLGINDMTYGLQIRNGSAFVVSSGISDWALSFKTGCFSEYFVIDLLGVE